MMAAAPWHVACDSMRAREDWSALAATASGRTMVFQSPSWVTAVHESLSGRQRLELWTVHDGEGTARAVAPMWCTETTMRFAGSPLNDHNGAIVAERADEARAAPLLVSAWVATGRSVVLGELAELAPWTQPTQGRARLIVHREVSPLLEIGGAWDDYRTTVSRRLRADRERALRRAESIGASFEVVDDPGSVGDTVTAMLRRRREAWRARGRFEELSSIERRPGHPRAIGAAAAGLARTEQAMVARLAADGPTLAADLWFRRGDVWHLYTRHYEDDFRSLGPGGALLWWTLRHLRAHGTHRFDFGRGDEDYKYRLGAEDVELHEVSWEPCAR